MIRAAALTVIFLAAPAGAVEFDLPATARQTVARNTGPDTYAAPVGVFDGQTVPTIMVEGDIARAAWRISQPGLTPFQVMRPLREQLLAAGYDIALDCPGDVCGGFDFRFATETLPGPNMYVNLRAYHVVTGLRSVSGEVVEAVTLLASSSASAAYVQIIRASTSGEAEVNVTTGPALPVVAGLPPAGEALDDSLASRLLAHGHAVLDDLIFDVGSTNLGAGENPALRDLAQFLLERPAQRVALVGHTDTVGSLNANIAVSRARAASVRDRLIAVFGVPADQLDAEGMGYLSPVASNLAPEGRERNRRVEAVLLSPVE